MAFAGAAWAIDVGVRTERRDVIATVAKVEAEALATFGWKDSHRMTGSAVELPLACLDAFGLEAWLFAFVAREIPSGFVDFDIRDSLVESSVLQGAPFALDTPALGCC